MKPEIKEENFFMEDNKDSSNMGEICEEEETAKTTILQDWRQVQHNRQTGHCSYKFKALYQFRMTAEKFKQLSLFLQVYTQLVKDHFKVKRAKDKRLSKTEKNV